MKSFLNLRQQLSSAVSAEYRRIWRGFKFPTTNKKPRRFFNRAVIGRRLTHLREYSSRLIGSALGLYRHMDHGHSLGYASVTHRNMMEHCTRIRRDQVTVLGSLVDTEHILLLFFYAFSPGSPIRDPDGVLSKLTYLTYLTSPG